MAKLYSRVGEYLSQRANFKNFRVAVLEEGRKPLVIRAEDGVNLSQLPGFSGAVISRGQGGIDKDRLSVQILGNFVDNIKLYPKS